MKIIRNLKVQQTFEKTFKAKEVKIKVHINKSLLDIVLTTNFLGNQLLKEL